jgi:hypothetical protein
VQSTHPFSCVLVGSESLLIQCGEIVLKRGHEIRGVVSRTPRIAEWAGAKHIELIAPGKGLASTLEPIGFDYLFSITNLAILPEEVLALARKASINFHDGPLPRYAGMYAPSWAIFNGECEHGVVFHAMTAGADEGDIYASRSCRIAPGDTSLTLNTRNYLAAIGAFRELIAGLEAGTATAEPQDLTQRSYFASRRPSWCIAIIACWLARPGSGRGMRCRARCSKSARTRSCSQRGAERSRSAPCRAHTASRGLRPRPLPSSASAWARASADCRRKSSSG